MFYLFEVAQDARARCRIRQSRGDSKKRASALDWRPRRNEGRPMGIELQVKVDSLARRMGLVEEKMDALEKLGEEVLSGVQRVEELAVREAEEANGEGSKKNRSAGG